MAGFTTERILIGVFAAILAVAIEPLIARTLNLRAAA